MLCKIARVKKVDFLGVTDSMNELREQRSQLYGKPLNDTDITCISDALSGFFSLLKTWNDKEVTEDGKNIGDNIPSAGPK